MIRATSFHCLVVDKLGVCKQHVFVRRISPGTQMKKKQEHHHQHTSFATKTYLYNKTNVSIIPSTMTMLSQILTRLMVDIPSVLIIYSRLSIATTYITVHQHITTVNNTITNNVYSSSNVVCNLWYHPSNGISSMLCKWSRLQYHRT